MEAYESRLHMNLTAEIQGGSTGKDQVFGETGEDQEYRRPYRRK